GTIEDAGAEAAALGTLRRDEGGVERLLTSLAEAHCHGVTVDWHTVYAGTGARRIPLPTYPFQHQHYWLEDEPETAVGVSGPSAVEAEFWKAVEEGDEKELARRLEGVEAGALSAVLPALAAWRRGAVTRATLDSWRYRVTWKPLAATGGGRALTGAWLVVVPESGVEGALMAATVRELTGRGARVIPLVLGEHQRDREELAKVLRAALVEAEGTEFSGVLSLLAVAAGTGEAETALGIGLPTVTAGTLALVQALDDSGMRAPLWCVTSGAVQIGQTGRPEPVSSPVQAQLWGMGQAIALEAPGSWGGLIDLSDITVSEGSDASVVERMCAVLAGDLGDEDQVVVRGSDAFARRIEHAGLGDTVRPFEPRDTALITGGTGSVGGHVARWLAELGAGHIVLTSRRGPDAPGAAELVEELERAGATATVVACDVADREQVDALVERLRVEGRPVRSVFHTAGVDDTAAVQDTDAEAYAAVLSGKVNGALHLDDALGDSADAFVLFSSISGVWGNARHSAYAAANASLDALAHRRRAQGRTATSVAWGWWEGDGLAGGAGVGGALSGLGLSAMSPELAVTAMRQAVEHEETAIVVADIDWQGFAPAFTAMRPSPLIGDLPEVRGARPTGDGTTPEGAEESARDTAGLLRAELVELPGPEREFVLLELVRDHAAAVLGLTGPGEVRPDRAFRKLGFDSLTAVDLRNRIVRATGLRLPAALVFDHPTPSALAGFLLRKLDLPQTAGDGPASPLTSVPASAEVAASPETGPSAPAAATDDSIDDMDAESLIQLALGDNGS
ncbi:SDR family NAD(P)-dependent oxidoreductase, partial [Streptomyces sp. NPDC050388]|uniref:SDR family NAD(P)-dependent oxidoreductase n=1 Tax=Streptomyces sp. NPDC050388 TaxID=3155781 RepID=UPI003421DB3F